MTAASAVAAAAAVPAAAPVPAETVVAFVYDSSGAAVEARGAPGLARFHAHRRLTVRAAPLPPPQAAAVH
jgi:hypothetical protein